MNYWKYPVYLPNKTYQYDWCNMPDELIKFEEDSLSHQLVERRNFQNEVNAIAKLMLDCGTTSKMKYCYRHKCQSFAWPIDARNAFVDSFIFSSDAIRRLRSSHSAKTWKKMIIKNLQEGKPVLYAGVSYKYDDYEKGGHAFVCDGYDANTEMFHFNWGWNGNYNNVWCTIDSIVSGNYNWNHLERAVFDIFPANNQNYCNLFIPLSFYYNQYYNTFGNTTPAPYEIVPKTASTLYSAYKSDDTPQSWYTIPAGASAEYVAHNDIWLLDGFYAEEGSDFYAHIEPCAFCVDASLYDYSKSSMIVEAIDSLSNDTLFSSKSKHTDLQSVESLIKLFPSPTTGELNIELSNPEETVSQIEILNITGNVAMRLKNVNSGIDVSSLSSGLYVARVTTSAKNVYHPKLTKK